MPTPKSVGPRQQPAPAASSPPPRPRSRAALGGAEVIAAAPVTEPVVASAPVPRATRPKGTAQRAKLARRASALLKFVSDPTRLQVILFLVDGERHVGALCEQLGQSQPAVSHHLALLRHGGIILPRRVGKNNFYTLSDTGRELSRLVDLLLVA